jgi:biotin synthase-related radical SAM superfamily protein
MNDPNTWTQWSQHVLKELERLNENYESLRDVNQGIKEDIGKLGTLREDVAELKQWQKQRDTNISLAQVKQMVEDVNGLLKFKTVAITVWIGVQFLTGIIFALLKYIV